MSASRDAILKTVRANRTAEVDLPDLTGDWIRYDDPLQQFRGMLESGGGTSALLSDAAEADRWLREQTAYADSSQRLSMVPGVGASDVVLDQLDTPQDLARLDWAVLRGEFAVAENGAIWTTDIGLRHRAVYFLCEHLVLVLDSAAIVHHMHEAYDRLSGFAMEEEPPFGCFISGPSKTADIEQSLVIGAQGPRSLDVLLFPH